MRNKSMILILVLIFLFAIPLNSFGTINTISFKDVENLVRVHSQLIQDNLESFTNASKGTLNSIAATEALLEDLNGALSDFNLWIGTLEEEQKNNLQGSIDAINYLLNTQQKSLTMQRLGLEAARDNQDMGIQIEMANDTIVWNMEMFYITYNTLNSQLKELMTSADLLREQTRVLKKQKELGMTTDNAILEVEAQLSQLNASIQQLTTSRDALKHQLNINLAQDYDTALEIMDVPKVTEDQIRAIDPEEDIVEALIESYMVRLKRNDPDQERDEQRKFRNGFFSTYQTILDKQKVLEVEKRKMNLAKTKYSFAELKYKLGMLSEIQLISEKNSYTNQIVALEVAENNLFQAYRAYEWAKRGLIVSTGSSGTPAA